MSFGKSWHQQPRLIPSAVKPLWHQLLPAMKKPPQVSTFFFSLCHYFYSSVHSVQIFQIFCIPVRRNLRSCFLGTSAPCYNDVETLTEVSWNDCNIRRIFIRKVRALTSPW